MNYFDYRSFIKVKVLEVCPDLKEHKDGFNRENISSVTASSGYHILPGAISSDFVSSQCDDYEDTMAVSLQLIFCGGRYVANEIDDAIAKASCIRNELIKRDQYPIDETLVRINVTGITPEALPDNDNTILINMDLELLLQYCTDSCV